MDEFEINISTNQIEKLKQFVNHSMNWEKWDTPEKLLENFIQIQIEEYEAVLKDRFESYLDPKPILLWQE